MLNYQFIKVDYYEILRVISNHIGKENIIVRTFDKNKFHGGAIHIDFLHHIGLELADEYQKISVTRNSSLTKNNIEIKRLLNTIPNLDEETKIFFRKLVSKCSDENPELIGYNMFSMDELKKYMSSFELGNKRIAKEYIGTDDDLFSTSYETENKWTPDNPEMYKDIILLIGNITTHLLIENRKLKKK